MRGFSRQILLLLPAVLLCSECSKDHLLDCLKSTGKIMTENRPASSIHYIELKKNVDLEIYRGRGNFIRVTAGQNLLDGIITEIQGDKLYIRNENKCNWVRKFGEELKVEIGLDTLIQIDTYGSGNVEVKDTLFADDFTYNSWNASGNANLLIHCNTSHINNNIGRVYVTASGISGVSYVYLNDTGLLDAFNLSTGFSFLRNSGTGFLKVSVTKEIGSDIRYTGNIYYRGEPYAVNSVISGSGKLIHVN